MAPDMAPQAPALERVRFTSEHEHAGVLYQPGQEAEVAAAEADYIETVAKSGRRVSPGAPATEPTERGPRRDKE